MMPQVLGAALTKDQQEVGFCLVEDAGQLDLRLHSILISTYDPKTVTIAQILWDAARYAMEAVIADLRRMARQ